MRGTPREEHRQNAELGITPAYAGNTFALVNQEPNERDHPRVCGEHLVNILKLLI